MKRKYFVFVTLILTLNILNLVSIDLEELNLNGYIKTNIYTNNQIDSLASHFSELSLKFEIKNPKSISAFSDLRISYDNNETEVKLRESYLNANLSLFNFRMGHQIIAWGKTDLYNPTNNLNAYDYNIKSPDEDDLYVSDFKFLLSKNIESHMLEFVFIPKPETSVFPSVSLNNINLSELNFTEKNNDFAGKYSFSSFNFDGSFSYYNGLSKIPGVAVDQQTGLLKSNLYKKEIFGADFSSDLNDFGIRGEIAFTKTEDSHKSSLIPNSSLDYALGIDKIINGNFNLILQYYGKCVFDWEELVENIPMYQVQQFNRIVSNQTEKIQHILMYHLSWDLNYQTIHIDHTSSYNTETTEILINGDISYNIYDNLSLTLGCDYYDGKTNTLFNILEDFLTNLHLELKAGF